MLNNSICPSFVLHWTRVHLVISGTELLKCWKLQGIKHVWTETWRVCNPKQIQEKIIFLWSLQTMTCVSKSLYNLFNHIKSRCLQLRSPNATVLLLGYATLFQTTSGWIVSLACQSVRQRPGALLNSQVSKKYVVVCLVSMYLASPVQSPLQGTHNTIVQ